MGFDWFPFRAAIWFVFRFGQAQGDAGKLSIGAPPPPRPTTVITSEFHPSLAHAHTPYPHPYPELYPQVLGKSALVNVPRFFSAVFQIFRVFLTAKCAAAQPVPTCALFSSCSRAPPDDSDHGHPPFRMLEKMGVCPGDTRALPTPTHTHTHTHTPAIFPHPTFSNQPL